MRGGENTVRKRLGRGPARVPSGRGVGPAALRHALCAAALGTRLREEVRCLAAGPVLLDANANAVVLAVEQGGAGAQGARTPGGGVHAAGVLAEAATFGQASCLPANTGQDPHLAPALVYSGPKKNLPSCVQHRGVAWWGCGGMCGRPGSKAGCGWQSTQSPAHRQSASPRNRRRPGSLRVERRRGGSLRIERGQAPRLPQAAGLGAGLPPQAATHRS